MVLSRLTGPVFALGVLSCASFCRALFGRRQGNARPAGFAQTDRDGLLWGTCTVFSLANMFNLFVDELSCSSRWRFALFKVAFRTSNGFLFRHWIFLHSLRDAYTEPS